MTAAVYPLINGTRPSFSDIQFRITNAPGLIFPPIIDIESLNYSDKMSPQLFHMTGPFAVARTRGHYEANGSIAWGLEAHRIVAAALQSIGAGGAGDVRFDIQVSYAHFTNSALSYDLLRGVRLIDSTQDNSVGGRALSTTTHLSINRIQWGGTANVFLTGPLATSA